MGLHEDAEKEGDTETKEQNSKGLYKDIWTCQRNKINIQQLHMYAHMGTDVERSLGTIDTIEVP